MKIEFTDREFVNEHGRAPKGYGGWGFSFEDCEFWATGTLTDAKKACRAYIKQVAPKDYDEYGNTITVTIMP